MTIRQSDGLNITAPRDWDELAVMWYENFAILRQAKIVNEVLLEDIIVDSDPAVDSNNEVVIFMTDLPPHFLHVGDMIKWVASGIYTNASASDDFTIRVYHGATLLHTIDRIGGNVTDEPGSAEYKFTIRDEGVNADMTDYLIVFDGANQYASSDLSHIFDSTVASTMSMTFQWDNSKVGNVMRMTQGHIEYAQHSIGL